jgi:hypothetical protein
MAASDYARPTILKFSLATKGASTDGKPAWVMRLNPPPRLLVVEKACRISLS